MKIKLSIFGSSEIINHHIKAARKNSFEIFSICTSNKNSKNVLKISKKYKISKVFYNWKAFIKNSKKKENINFYKKQRKRFDILMDPEGKPVGGKWSFDSDNRKKLP